MLESGSSIFGIGLHYGSSFILEALELSSYLIYLLLKSCRPISGPACYLDLARFRCTLSINPITCDSEIENPSLANHIRSLALSTAAISAL